MSETKKILIVDDEQDVLTYFEAIFQDNGYDTVSAKDGIEGFELAKSEKPDLIVLDIAMPQQSGLKTYRQYKGHPALTNIPVIIITAVDDSFRIFLDEIKELAPPEGIINKPIDPQELLKVVAEILSD
jgi:CheY-like chemotaxis protein